MKYASCYGKDIGFNEHVVIEMLFGVADEKRIGRLVQVRKGVGQFGSDVFIIRLRDGGLASFENALIRRADDAEFEHAFYRLNGKQPPATPPFPPHEGDSERAEYSIANKWPEVGFIVENSKQPQTPGAFAIAVVSPKP